MGNDKHTHRLSNTSLNTLSALKCQIILGRLVMFFWFHKRPYYEEVVFLRLVHNVKCKSFSLLLCRWVYWTDWGDTPYIGRAGMDGRNISAIITTKLEWPNALTIDYTTNKIFFADSHLNFLE